MEESNHTPPVSWGDEALDDVERIIDYVKANGSLAAASDLLDLITNRTSSLASMPKKARPGRVEGTRELVISPIYLAVYKENPEEVTILRVLHAKQKWPA